jgi:hypothetical protein
VMVSFISTPDCTELGITFLSRFISVGPVCSVTVPTEALVVVGLNCKAVARTSNSTNDLRVN